MALRVSICLLRSSAVFLALCLPLGTLAHQSYQSAIPNGDRVPGHPGLGHINPSGGLARNQFGLDFASAGYEWTKALCQGDADGDGQSNGFELGDPDCTWQPGRTPTRVSGISDPSLASSTSAPSPQSTTRSPPTPTPSTTSAPPVTPAPPATPAPPNALGVLSLFPGFTLRWSVVPARVGRRRAQDDLLQVTLTSQSSHDWLGLGRAKSAMQGVQIVCAVLSNGTGECLDLQADANFVVSRRPQVTTVLNASISASGYQISWQTPLSSLGGEARAASRTIFARGPVWTGPVTLPTPHSSGDTLAQTVDFYTGATSSEKKRRWNWIALAVAVATLLLVTLVGVVFTAAGVLFRPTQRSVIWGLGYLLLLGLWVMVIVVSWAGYKEDGASVPAGRAFGDGATFLFFVVLWPTARHIGPVSLLGSSYERFLSLHSTVGGLILISLTVHFGLMWNAFAQGGQSLARQYILRWDTSAPRINVAGFIAWLALLVVILPTMARRYSFGFFKLFHALFFVVIVFGAIHHPPLWLFVGPALAMFLVDLVCRFAANRQARATVLHCAYHETAELTELVIGVRNLTHSPCQFVFLRFSGVGGLYHPFSIAGWDEAAGSVRFYIKACGPWTRQLASIAAPGNPAALGDVLWLGPYGALEVPLTGVRTAVCVCGGVGVTPMLSLLQLLSNPSPVPSALRTLVFVWIVRTTAVAQVIGPHLDDYLGRLKGTVTVSASIHVTRPPPKDCGEQQPSFQNLQVLQGRPDLGSVFSSAAGPEAGRTACYICGPADLTTSASNLAASAGMYVHTECFEL